MNDVIDDPVLMEEEERAREALNGLMGASAIEGDLKNTLRIAARGGVMQIIKALEEDYKKTYNVHTAPEAISRVLHTRAHLNYVRHLACLMKDMKLVAFDPDRRI